VYHLTGVELAPVKQSIREEDEYKLDKTVMPSAHSNEELADVKKTTPKPLYSAITKAFSILWGLTPDD